MDFKKYQHVEKFGSDEVQNIEVGTCYVFPKIDGTNASVWASDRPSQACTPDAKLGVQAGSRQRWLAEGQNDNAGFREALKNDPQFDGIKRALAKFPYLRFYGEWLVPHTLKTYRADAWRKFYVFDVTEETSEGEFYIPYLGYKAICEEFGINYIPCIAVIKNGSYEDFIHVLQQNNYLIEDGKGIGEGIVIKNYDFVNQWGRITWAKIITSEFKEQFHKVMGPNERENKMIEEEIVNLFCTPALVEKTYAKIVNEGGWNSKAIPRLFETVYHDLVTEEIYNILKKMNSPTINFKTLRVFAISKVKQVKPELF